MIEVVRVMLPFMTGKHW